MTFADKVIEFNKALNLNVSLPNNISVMNPFKENVSALETSSSFYKKYYNDNNQRTLILGINPGRLGAGVTGIPFTDTKRLKQYCNLDVKNISTHEISSVFIYDVIKEFGGVNDFYKNFYINSVSPLGFIVKDQKGKEKNYNYYDNKRLTSIVKPFILKI